MHAQLASSRAFRRFTLAALAFCLFVIVWGAWVRASGSGAGCGAHWPTCNGQVFPTAPSSRTVIEFTHRLTSGLSLLSVVAMWVWARRAHRKGHAVVRSAGWSAFFMVTEALLGAALVKLELVADNATANRAVAMSLHLVNTFLLLSAMTSCAVWAHLGDGVLRWKGRGLLTATLPLAFALTMLVGVSGAIAALGDTLVQQSVASPFVDLLIRLRVLHPLLAIAGTTSLLAVAWLTHETRAASFARGLAALVVLQIACGLINVILQAPVWLQLVHLLLADLVWLTLVVVSRLSLVQPSAPRPPVVVPQPMHPGEAFVEQRPSAG